MQNPESKLGGEDCLAFDKQSVVMRNNLNSRANEAGLKSVRYNNIPFTSHGTRKK